ncbi:eukaryotic release factor 1 (eRF1) family protein [Actinidia rufa]|uniref:Eukaryotic release factor 1 (ERF1) family protein n=1 Tax=Actinidia rufa TaxID=165716 RepID=A0A7J0D970_9ERIC|nr:eukaryotic release factor 1 (eRF1) family protein [Actinidia rufa]
MKIVRRDYVPNGPGSVKMVAEESEDLWLAYNLISEGDSVLAVTVRKVLREAASGARDAERVKLKLEIKVEMDSHAKDVVRVVPILIANSLSFRRGWGRRWLGEEVGEALKHSHVVDEHVDVGDDRPGDWTNRVEEWVPGIEWSSSSVELAAGGGGAAAVDGGDGAEKIGDGDGFDGWVFGLVQLDLSFHSCAMANIIFKQLKPKVFASYGQLYCVFRFVHTQNVLRSIVEARLEACKAVDYDKEGSVLRIRGKNILENEYVKIGAFHTLEVELCRPFVLRKEVWDSLALDVLHQASDPTASADLAVVLMQEGLAHILLIGKSVTTTRSRIEASIPRKHGPAIAGYDKALNKFFENVTLAFLKHVDFNVVRCAVIASPGFTKDQFHRHLLLEAERRQLRAIIENKSRIILVHTTSGYKHSLREVLDAPSVMDMIKDTKAAQEDPARACYGPKHVEVAHERMAIQTLLITDELFRSSDVVTRQKYVNFVNSVKHSGGTALVFSSMHVSGERKYSFFVMYTRFSKVVITYWSTELAQLTGIAAILRFPLPDLEDIEM